MPVSGNRHHQRCPSQVGLEQLRRTPMGSALPPGGADRSGPARCRLAGRSSQNVHQQHRRGDGRDHRRRLQELRDLAHCLHVFPPRAIDPLMTYGQYTAFSYLLANFSSESRGPAPRTTTLTWAGTQKRHSLRRSECLFCGGAEGNRTPDLFDANEARYQLRHSPARILRSARQTLAGNPRKERIACTDVAFGPDRRATHRRPGAWSPAASARRRSARDDRIRGPRRPPRGRRRPDDATGQGRAGVRRRSGTRRPAASG